MLKGRFRLQTARPWSLARAYSAQSVFRPVPSLGDGTLTTFRHEAFNPALPRLLPRKHFLDTVPAVSRWFTPIPSTSSAHVQEDRSHLNTAYLSPHADALVPLEISSAIQFSRAEHPLSFFLSACAAPPVPGTSIYLAQASIPDLPPVLQADVPTPELVRRAGRGDVYGSSVWLGRAPTYTPLHRDPNPNLFVQLAGRKSMRLFVPEAGGKVFAKVKGVVGGGGNATMRGEEMMVGEERSVLEEVVWGESAEWEVEVEGWECEVDAGDGLFIPKGWWHSIRGIGEGMTGSVRVHHIFTTVRPRSD